jgi:hypothetical protein
MREENTIKRGDDGKFMPGTSRPKNAGRGRKRVPKDVKEAFEALSHKTVEAMQGILNDETVKPSDRLKAAERVLDRALGKPHQALDVSANIGGDIDWEDINLDVLIDGIDANLDALIIDETDTLYELLEKIEPSPFA